MLYVFMLPKLLWGLYAPNDPLVTPLAAALTKNCNRSSFFFVVFASNCFTSMSSLDCCNIDPVLDVLVFLTSLGLVMRVGMLSRHCKVLNKDSSTSIPLLLRDSRLI